MQSFLQDLHQVFISSKFQTLLHALLSFSLLKLLMLFLFLIQTVEFLTPTLASFSLLLPITVLTEVVISLVPLLKLSFSFLLQVFISVLLLIILCPLQFSISLLLFTFILLPTFTHIQASLLQFLP